MRLLLRLDGGVSAPLSLEVTVAEDTTVGELADHLSSMSGRPCGLTLNHLDRDARVATHGPRSGSTVRLAEPVAIDERVAWAPVHATITGSEPGTAGVTQQLRFGSNEVSGVAIHISELVEVRSTGSTTPLVNGQRVLGSHRLGNGDLVTLDSGFGSKSTFVIHMTAALKPPPTDGPQIGHRASRRLSGDFAPAQVDLPTPPEHVRLPGFPVLSAVVPLLMGAGLWLATRSVASSVFIVFSFVYVVASGLESRREARADEQFRLDQFRADLDEAEEAITLLHHKEQAMRSDHCPPVEDLTSLVLSRSERVWERPTDDPEQRSLTVRVGLGRTANSTRLNVPRSGRRDLRRELEALAERRSLTELPLTVDLDAGGGLALVGPGEVTTDVARWILIQLAAMVAPDQLRIVVLADPMRRSAWEWSSWLPHVQATGVTHRTLLVVDGAADADVERALALVPEASARLLWLSPSRVGIPERIRQMFEVGDQPQLRVYQPDAGSTGAGPASAGSTDAANTAPSVQRLGAQDIRVEDMIDDQALPLARCLAPLVPSRSILDHPLIDPSLGEDVRLGDVLANEEMLDSPEAVLHQWSLSSSQRGLGAPVGKAGRGVVHLDLRADGPHALVAGTTGSGKSEFLRSMVASLALHNGPDRLTFLLVDYKGGAAFNSLDQLPHSVGMITDLSPDLAERALTSLRAEVLRREKVLASLGLVDLNEPSTSRSTDCAPLDGGEPVGLPPALVVVVDEFATLARELPDFVEGLVDIAQRGRSLGIHLILATQRPAGVVTDSIRANTSLRVALRVADPDDSTDVVESPDAAELPRSSPGRALVRIGSSAPVQVQFAYSASSSQRPARVVTTDLGPGPIATQVMGLVPAGTMGHGPGPREGSTELSRAIAMARAAAQSGGTPPPRRPWVPPLPDVVSMDTLASATCNSIAIGLIDRPSKQRVDPLTVEWPACGGVLILGAGGSGRSSTLATIGSSSPAEVYLIGLQRGVFADSSHLGWLSDAVEAADAERTLRLLRSADAQLKQCRTSGGARRKLILVDDYAAFEEFHERVNRGEAIELLSRIAREGRSAGVHVAISAQRRIEVPPSLASSLGMHILLRCASEDDASMLGLNPSAAAKDVPPGRGHVNGELVQIAVPDVATPDADPPGITGCKPGAGPQRAKGPRIEALPEQVDFGQLIGTLAARAGLGEPEAGVANHPSIWRSLLVGVNGDDLSPARLNLEHSHLVVAGPRRSGRSTTLELLAAALEASALQVSASTIGFDVPERPVAPARAFLLSARVIQSSSRWTAVLNASESTGLVGAEDDLDQGRSGALKAFLGMVSASALSGTPTLLAVDDFPDLLESSLEGHVESGLAELVELAERAPLRMVLSGEIESITRSFSSTLTRVRAGRTAILIQPDPDVHGSIAHCDIPRRDELRSMPGRGWLICDSKPSPVQLALP